MGSIPINSAKHYVNEVGSIIIVNTGVDLTTATATQIRVKKPDGTVAVYDADVYTISGSPNYLKYTTLTGDLDQAGKYLVQPYVVFPTWQGYGETSYFIVNNLFN
jgi:hypothetical protein